MSELKVNAITNAAGGNTATINGMTPTADSLQGFRNRIINGDMRIDQRNAGASGTANGYAVDRWGYFGSQASKGTWQQNAGSVTPPAGFANYLGFTSSSAYSVLATDDFVFYQHIEGFNFSDMNFGTANATAVTLSFWVRSSLTGTFGGGVSNSAYNRSYPFSFTISSANTWEQKTVTIAGDTTGTWVGSTNGVGLTLRISLGSGSNLKGTEGVWSASGLSAPTGAISVVGTSGATFYITGVQLEAGSVATPFERRPFGAELALCMRYYQQYSNIGAFAPMDLGVSTFSNDTSTVRGTTVFPVPMRAAPVLSLVSGTLAIDNYGTATTTTISGTAASTRGLSFSGTGSGYTTGRPSNLIGSPTAVLALNSEL